MRKAVTYTVISSVGAVVCGLSIVGILLMPVDRPAPAEDTTAEITTVIETTLPEEVTEKVTTAKDYLILVNGENALPADYTVVCGEIDGQPVDESIIPFVQAFVDAATDAGYPVSVRSALRTAEEQQRAFDEYLNDFIRQGFTEEEAYAKAEKWAMKPGYSEHQTGLALDINPISENEEEKTAAYVWLETHCAEYGFILRYPKDKTDITGIGAERWHFRFVGKEVAAYIMANSLTLEEYLAPADPTDVETQMPAENTSAVTETATEEIPPTTAETPATTQTVQ